MVLFNTVQYSPELADDSWTSYAEAMGDICQAPGRWFAAEVWGGGKKYLVTQCSKEQCTSQEVVSAKGDRTRHIVRLCVGATLSIFGQLLALPLKGFAYTNAEIRLKHQVAYRPLTADERQQLADMIRTRQTLAKERQGCTVVIGCALCSICSLLCSLVCK